MGQQYLLEMHVVEDATPLLLSAEVMCVWDPPVRLKTGLVIFNGRKGNKSISDRLQVITSCSFRSAVVPKCQRELSRATILRPCRGWRTLCFAFRRRNNKEARRFCYALGVPARYGLATLEGFRRSPPRFPVDLANLEPKKQ